MAITCTETPFNLDRGDFRDANKQMCFLEVTSAGTVLVGLVSRAPFELTQAGAADLRDLLDNFVQTGTLDTPPP